MHEQTLPPRIIGRIDGPATGPLLLAIGGIHGNEPAGVQALERTMECLREAGVHQLDKGRFLAIRGNRRALVAGVRYLDMDLNRYFWEAHLHHAHEKRASEDFELLEIHDLIRKELAIGPPSELIVLDMHTTSSGGGFFAFTMDHPAQWAFGARLGLPVVQGFTDRMFGSTLHYFTEGRWKLPCRAVTVESGQHQEPMAVDVAEGFICRMLRLVFEQANLPVHPIEASIDAEMVTRAPFYHLLHLHNLRPTDQFKMRPGYSNFDFVRRGEPLADENGQPVEAPMDGYLLMPLYQTQGGEGFFIIQVSEI